VVLPFTFRQIEVFLEVCRAGNFRAAADRLQVSQPAISNQIKALESQLGKELFLRRPGASCVLSADGQAFKESAEQFFRQGESLSRGARRTVRQPKPLRVYIGIHLLEDYVRPHLEEFHSRHPHVTLTFLGRRTRSQLSQDVQRGRVDVVLVTCTPDDKWAATHILGSVAAGVFCRPDKFKVRSAGDLDGVPFILPPKGTPEAAYAIEGLRRLGIQPKRVASVTQYHDVMVRMAREGRGAIYTIQSVVDRHDPSRKLKRVLSGDAWERRVYVAPTVDRETTQAIISFLQKSIPTPSV
jgi:DNA-binding transcriptional LysR family regulator